MGKRDLACARLDAVHPRTPRWRVDSGKGAESVAAGVIRAPLRDHVRGGVQEEDGYAKELGDGGG